MSHQQSRKTIVIVGNGMVGHKLVDVLIQRDAHKNYCIVVFGEERYVAYDRVNLSAYFDGHGVDDLSLTTSTYYEEHDIEFHLSERVTEIDRNQQIITTEHGLSVNYDTLVLATGSSAFVPPIKGNDTTGNFVYRTIDDLQAIEAYAQQSKVGVVIGGGLLGLECANALRNLGLETHVVEFASRLMPRQLDDVGAMVLRKQIEQLGIGVHTSKSTQEIVSENGNITHLEFSDGTTLNADMVVFSAGIRPRDELARAAGLTVGQRGGIIIDEYCQTSDPNIFAIGECALYRGMIYGLVAPGYDMAKVVADQLTVELEPNIFTGSDMSTKLKLLGVDVASFGDAFCIAPNAQEMSWLDAYTGIYKKIVISDDAKTLLGGILVGDASDYGMLLQVMQNGIALPPHPEDLILPGREGGSSAAIGLDSLPDTAYICTCENVSKGAICSAIHDQNLTTVGEIQSCTRAGTACKSCVASLKQILNSELTKMGVEVKNHVCEHFPYSRQELHHLIKVNEIHTFGELLERHGTGHGCEICKPITASLLASIWNDYIHEGEKATLQDTNDYYLANIQRDGTYSVVPRVPAGEITPDKLIVIGEVAKKYDLYVKITGGQRIDLLGAHLNELPDIWQTLIDAGFESGHAYGKALRTVKSCVGTTWCRYGQQDSVTMAITLENRYKGLRAPHKLKSACSGCARECAEAQSKDFGLIATERGYNLYLGGNGGKRPRHAQLFAEDLSEEEVIKYIDRYLMFYIRTASHLQRTADWLEQLEGGLDYLRQVIIEDSLGICEELERDMEHIVGTYQCEWKTTIEDPEKVKRYRHFVDSDQRDPNVVFIEHRGQKRPALPHERPSLQASGAAD